MTKQTSAVAKTEDRGLTEFVPFGSNDMVKLNISIVRSLVAVPTKTGQMPKDTECIKFIAMCKARRLNPFEGDAFLIGYDSRDGAKFNLITAHQAFLKRAELNAEYNGMKSGCIVQREGVLVDLEGDFHLEDDVVMGGWATVYFKTRQNPMHKRIRLKRFQKAFGVWQEDPAGMICKCAEADALRSSFPTMLGGLYLKEEMDREVPTKMSEPIFSTPTAEVVDEPAEIAPINPVHRILELCKQDDILEADLLIFLEGIGLNPDNADTVGKLDPGNMDTLLNSWSDISAKLREELI